MEIKNIKLKQQLAKAADEYSRWDNWMIYRHECSGEENKSLEYKEKEKYTELKNEEKRIHCLSQN